jgi:PAS domain S-box-containing protein
MSLLQKFKSTLSTGSRENHHNGVTQVGEARFDINKNLLLLLNSVPSVISYVDKNHCLQYVNQAFEATFRCESDAVIGRPIAEFMGVEGYRMTKGYMETALSGKPVHYEMEIPFKDCTRFIEASYTPDIDEFGNVNGYVGLILDISEKKKTEEKLRRRELELQGYIDSASVGLHWVDGDGIILWANRAELDLLGYSEKEYIGKHIAQFHADQDCINDILTRLLNGQVLHQCEARLVHKDGSIRTVLISSSGLWEDGKFVHTRCSTTDITYRKGIEERLEETRTNYRVLVENLPAALYTCDANGVIMTFNKAAVDLWGRTPEVGKDLWCGSWKIFEPDGVTPMELDTCPMAVTLKEGRAVTGKEIIIERPDGQRRNVQPFPMPMLDKTGKVSGAVNMLLDITEQKTSERELAHLAAIIHSSTDAIVSKTLTGIVTSWNKAAERVFGYSASEMIGQPILKLIPADRANEEPTILERLKRGEMVEHFETKRVTKDGRELDVSLSISPIRDRDGRAVGAAKIVRDVTAQKKLHRALIESEERLRMAISSTQLGTWEYDPVNQILVWSDEAKKIYGAPDIGNPSNEFVAGLSHPEDREYVRLEVVRAMDPNGTGEFNIQQRFYRASDHELRWLKVSGKVFFNDARQPIRFIGTMLDITDEKITGDLIRESEERLRMAVQSTKLGTWRYYPGSGALTWSEECCVIYGYPAEKPVDYAFFTEHIYPDDRNFVEAAIAKAMKHGSGGNYDVMFRIRRFETHEVRWVKAQGRVFFDRDRNPERFIGTIFDITEQRLAQEALEESEQRSRLSIDAANMGTFNWDLVTQEFSGSLRLIEIFGFHGQTKITHRQLINAIHPDDRGVRDQKVKGSSTTGAMSYEVRILWPDKSTHWVRVYGKVMFSDVGRPLRMIGTVMDITDEKEAVAALEDSKTNLDIAIRAAELGMWELNLKTQVATYSDRYVEIMGFEKGSTPTHDELLERIHPEDLALREKCLNDAYESGVLDMAVRIWTKQRKIRWINAKGKVFYNENYEPEKILGTLHDVTDTRAMFNTLQESEERFKIIANTAPVMIWMSGNDKFEDFFNENWLTFTGRTQEEESNQGWLENVFPEDVDRVIHDHRQSFIEQKEFYTEYRMKRRDGQYRWIADHSVPRHNADGSFAGFISACTDIDDQKTFSSRIMESELLFKTISSAAPVGLWMTDATGKNTFVNDTWMEWTGLPFEQQLGVGWLDRLVEEDKKEAPANFANCLAKKEKYSTEFRLQLPDGGVRWCLTEGSPYYNIDGEFAGYAGSVTDITELKRAEERKDDFIRMASHELKTPITSIKGYVQLLLKIHDELNEEKFAASRPTVKASLRTVSNQVSKLTRLVSELLDLSRIESGRLDLDMTTFSISDLVRETIQDIRQTTTLYEIVEHHDFDGSIYADRDRIAQVLINLLTNAIKYSPHANRVEVYVEATKNVVAIKIKDFGIGIDERDQRMIFQRFYRVEGKSEQTFPGFGIGLFISSEIVQRHRGTILVDSKKGKGSTFTITLPIAG